VCDECKNPRPLEEWSHVLSRMDGPIDTIGAASSLEGVETEIEKLLSGEEVRSFLTDLRTAQEAQGYKAALESVGTGNPAPGDSNMRAWASSELQRAMQAGAFSSPVSAVRERTANRQLAARLERLMWLLRLRASLQT
jgi:hypothetical protein